MFTLPQIYIPKIEINEKFEETIKKGKYWYVYYFFRNPSSGKMQEFREKQGLNMINRERNLNAICCFMQACICSLL